MEISIIGNMVKKLISNLPRNVSSDQTNSFELKLIMQNIDMISITIYNDIDRQLKYRSRRTFRVERIAQFTILITKATDCIIDIVISALSLFTFNLSRIRLAIARARYDNY